MRIERVTILDGYVDEPAALGVPPYLSPYPRYAAGVARLKGAEVYYRTIDQLRADPSILGLLNASDVVVAIAGTAVPGKYLGGTPASLDELGRIMRHVTSFKLLGGPAARFGSGVEGGKRAMPVEGGVFDIIARGDVEAVLWDVFEHGQHADPEKIMPRGALGEIARAGAEIIEQHPDYPYTMCELETYRGCFRARCSFCVEPFYGPPDFRPPEDVVAEVAELYRLGARHFRIGRQPDLFTYLAEDREEFPRPNPDAIERLYRGIRKVAPDLKALHMDNANPGTIARYPIECRQIAKTIVKYHTSGDVAAFGMESADPRVIRANRLKASPEEVLRAIEIINEVGASRGPSGLPELLPGINIVHGLLGETPETYELNYKFLRDVYDRGLMLRRINIRQVMPFPGTMIWERGEEIMAHHKDLYQEYKRKIREEVDLPMLRRVVPVGSVLRNVRIEAHENHLALGRQIATYPILVGVPDTLHIGEFHDLAIVDHGHRSITGIPYPLDVNEAPISHLRLLPGVGRKRAGRLVAARPIRNSDDIRRALIDENIVRSVMGFLGWGGDVSGDG